MLTIYRSSAGAGKTHTLVSAYLKQALDQPEAFTQTLAVTFTNQATQEMKQRILAYLHSLAQGTPSALADELQRAKGWDNATLQRRAQAVLTNILHQYTRFSVSTIDSFFQKVIRSFAQELGLQRGFRIELAQKHVLDTLIDELVEAAGQDTQLRQWLITFAEEKLLSGKHWHFRRELATLGQELFSESFGAQQEALVQATTDQTVLHHFAQQLSQCITTFEQQLQRLGQQANAAIQRAGLAVQDFAYGQAGAAGYLAGLATKRRRWTPTQRALQALQHVGVWHTRTSDKQDHIRQVVQQTLQPCLQQVVDFYQAHHCHYYTALAVQHFFYAFGISTQLLERLRDYRATHNVMLVSDATLFLRKIIAENDTPFVYEKIGAFYKHFLIDEFQDISGFQWHNLRPLIENSLNEGNASLVVGDVKQSIYRWRGGDWRLLLTQLEEDVGPTEVIRLAHNWRSKQHIVDFNNALFATAADALVLHLTSTLAGLQDDALRERLLAQAQLLGTAYQDVRQKLPPQQRMQPHKGRVRIAFVEDAEAPPQSWQQKVLAQLPPLIETLQQEGFAPKDIALLVRSHAEGRTIFRTLLAHQQSPLAQPGCQYKVISAESLYLSHNPFINLLVNALRCLADGSNSLAQAELLHLHQVYVLGTAPDATKAGLPEAFTAQRLHWLQLPLYELVEALISLFRLRQTAAAPFLQAFQDAVLAFSTLELADVHTFLTWWEELGYQHTLPRTQEQDAMTLMTIHQAKGLQFKVVIVPFCAWNLDHNPHHPPTLWCHTDAPPFAEFPSLPVRYAGQLRDTVYAQAYYEEYMQAHLDHLNLLYVAFTRPEDRLYVFAQRPTKATLRTTAGLLYHAVAQQQGWDAAAGVLTMDDA